MSRSIALLILLFFLTQTAPLQAGQINWASAFLAVNRHSTNALMDGQMTFELGVFRPGFTPAADNTALWAGAWRRASIAFYNVNIAYFNDVHDVTSNAIPFGPGTKGYIWGHNGTCTNGEWILMSAPSWGWPNTDPVAQPAYWTVGSATQIIVGQVNGPGFLMKTAAVSGPLPITTWAEWKSEIFSPAEQANPAISDPDKDPDKDGSNNLIEFALGGHPLIPGGTPGRITPGFIDAAGRQRLTLSVTKRCDRAVLWSAGASLDLQTWPPASTTTLLENAETLTVRENLTGLNDRRVFLRAVFQIP
jgi:hypothetical protein